MAADNQALRWALSLLMVFAWRVLLKRKWVQKQIHKLPWIWPALVQWQVVLLVVLFVFLFWDLYFTIYYDVFAYHLLDPDYIKPLWDAANISEEDRELFYIPQWLGALFFISIALVILGFAVLLLHLAIAMVRNVAQMEANEEKREIKYAITSRPQDMEYWIILLPGVFMVMATRSSIRMILIMVAHDVGETAVAQDERLYQINLVLAEVCQLLAVSIFAVLCIHFFSKDFQELDEQTRSLEQEGAVVVVSLPEKTRELVYNMKLVGFLGVISWVICGFMHDALFSFAFVQNLPPSDPWWSSADTLKSYASILAILATVNMMLVGRMQSISRGLPNPTLKFMGVKMLLLIAPTQQSVIQAFVKGNPKIPSFAVDFVNHLDMSSYQAKLLHTTLLNVECFGVIVTNIYAWLFINWLQARQEGKTDIGFRDMSLLEKLLPPTLRNSHNNNNTPSGSMGSLATGLGIKNRAQPSIPSTVQETNEETNEETNDIEDNNVVSNDLA